MSYNLPDAETAEVAEANEAKLIALFTIFQSPFSLPDHPHPRRLPESRRGRTAGPAPLPALSDLPPPHTGLTNRAIWALAFCVCSSAAAGVSVVVVAAVANEVGDVELSKRLLSLFLLATTATTAFHAR
jgi:hypothetical protein